MKNPVKENQPMPRFSIVMPVYNRADSIKRAIQSVILQTFQDWKLILVDDGSTDNSAALVQNMDSRIMVFRQENSGVARARNRALEEVDSDLIAFLDSDDEWLPHHLELADAFFRAFPEEHALTCEIWENDRLGEITNFQRSEFRQRARIACKLGSHRLDLPEGESDDYLRFFDERLPLGAWAKTILPSEHRAPAFHYRGWAADGWRWGFMTALQPTVITRHALTTVGFFDEAHYIASDFGFLYRICAAFRLNLISVPAFIKHEYGHNGAELGQDHLATGKTIIRMWEDMLDYHILFFCRGKNDREADALRGLYEYQLARLCLGAGNRDKTAYWLHEALTHFPRLWEARAGLELVKSLSSCRACYLLWELASILRFVQSAIRAHEPCLKSMHIRFRSLAKNLRQMGRRPRLISGGSKKQDSIPVMMSKPDKETHLALSR